jgi:hypothetical protein
LAGRKKPFGKVSLIIVKGLVTMYEPSVGGMAARTMHNTGFVGIHCGRGAADVAATPPSQAQIDATVENSAI